MYFQKNPYKYYKQYDEVIHNISQIDKIFIKKRNQNERLLSDYNKYINSYIK